MLPDGLVDPLRNYLPRVKRLHERDLAEGFGEVALPCALARKYPKAGREWAWQYVFPSGNRSVDPLTGMIRPITSIRRPSSGRSAKLPGLPASTNLPVAIRCAIVSRRICFAAGTTSGRFRNCWATVTFRRQWCTRTCSTAAAGGCGVRSTSWRREACTRRPCPPAESVHRVTACSRSSGFCAAEQEATPRSPRPIRGWRQDSAWMLLGRRHHTVRLSRAQSERSSGAD